MQHHRRSIRLQEYDYSQFGYYFITICTYDRECIFENLKFRTIVENIWRETPKIRKNVKLDEFVVMPNHLHGIIVIENDNSVGAIHELPLPNNEQSPEQWQKWFKQRRQMLLPKIIGWFKMNSAKQINKLLNRSGMPLWQRNYYEHIIRNNTELNKIRLYIQNNPQNWEFDRNNPKNFESCLSKKSSKNKIKSKI